MNLSEGDRIMATMVTWRMIDGKRFWLVVEAIDFGKTLSPLFETEEEATSWKEMS